MRKVEAQAIRCDQRSLLLHMLAEHGAQGGVQKVRRRMIEGDGGSPLAVDARLELVSHPQRPRLDHADVRERGADFLGIADREAYARTAERARVAHLPAAFRIERRLIQYDLSFLADAQAI